MAKITINIGSFAYMNPVYRKSKISRRDFLRIIGGLILGLILTKLPYTAKQAAAQSGQESTAEYSYFVYMAGFTYEAKNLNTGTIDYSNTDADVVINNALSSLPQTS